LKEFGYIKKIKAFPPQTAIFMGVWVGAASMHGLWGVEEGK